jgi:hypothetical protein
MLELLQESLKAPNLPATFLLMLVLVFWLVTLIGFIDIKVDLHKDVHVGLHKEVHVGAPKDIHVETEGNYFHSFLEFFHIGELPVTIIISFFSLFFWMGCVLLNHYLGNSSLWFGLIFMVPSIILALFLTKFITQPILVVYRKLSATEKIEQVTDFSGSVIYVTANATPDHMGQGEINRNGDSILVYVKTLEGELKRGETGLLIEQKKEKGYYIAAPYEQA